MWLQIYLLQENYVALKIFVPNVKVKSRNCCDSYLLTYLLLCLFIVQLPGDDRV